MHACMYGMCVCICVWCVYVSVSVFGQISVCYLTPTLPHLPIIRVRIRVRFKIKVRFRVGVKNRLGLQL